MPDITALIQSGATNPWFYLPLAVLLGALHALEPGHSKSMMAAFIIAVRGTPRQAILLGLSAALGHTIVVWAIALVGLWLGDRLILDKAEPWLLIVSGLLVAVLALRIVGLIGTETEGEHGHGHEGHKHDGHGHEGHDRSGHGHHHHHDGHRPESRHGPDDDPHHAHDDHHPAADPDAGLDAHAAAHAREIRTRFAGRRSVGTGEILWFGFTGGLLPCPAAIAVLLICLQMRAFTLGIGMVLAFSAGLAITMVAVGVAAAWGAGAARARWAGLDRWGARLPYLSAGIVLLLGFAMAARGVWMLA
ncbi:nickel/cobalt efflux transporter [Prosthecodimorpha staleyi]|uniref:Nickel/cobalt efflux system n=1 Tax=Prosthecodimorpha staleyi TaxID=2840188 RepID=A0A947D293_9HYPH|nr:nickel/cobalt efflux transporter [Prosthecodimorpha staleyi]MBT9289450.1 nickel/cobalt efflux transporter RcnA [Prosthecodimorpha staleyi]